MREWLADPRCVVRKAQVVQWRIRQGATFEEAISTSAWNEKLYEAFGELKTLPEWGRDPRCKIKFGTLYYRIKKGGDLEEMLSGPLYTGPKQNPLLTAFGESKRIVQWAEDPRCTVSVQGLYKRLQRGIEPEKAISGDRYDRETFEAFGEEKSISEWSRDPRCVVSFSALWCRMEEGEVGEDALTRPPHLPRPFGTRKGIRYYAFGLYLTISEWAEEPRCVVSADVLRRRLEAGMEEEQAITMPKQSYARLFFGFGESKSVSEWANDPRCVVTQSRLRKRLEQGETLEEALTRPVRAKVARFSR